MSAPRDRRLLAVPETPALTLETCVDAAVRNALEQRNGTLFRLVHEVVDRELERPDHDAKRFETSTPSTDARRR
jgi:hypothetical protein